MIHFTFITYNLKMISFCPPVIEQGIHKIHLRMGDDNVYHYDKVDPSIDSGSAIEFLKLEINVDDEVDKLTMDNVTLYRLVKGVYILPTSQEPVVREYRSNGSITVKHEGKTIPKKATMHVRKIFYFTNGMTELFCVCPLVSIIFGIVMFTCYK